METTMEIRTKLVALANQGRWLDAIHSLYDPEIISIEAAAPPGKSRQCTDLANIVAKTDKFLANHEIHATEVRGPFPHDDRFIVYFKLNLTAKAGPMTGRRFDLEEAALYTVKQGKIIKEEFFYHMAG